MASSVYPQIWREGPLALHRENRKAKNPARGDNIKVVAFACAVVILLVLGSLLYAW